MEKEKTLFNATVVLAVKNKKVLLSIKTRHIGAHCFNGYGGGINPGETPEECAVRELREETGGKKFKELGMIAKISDLEKVAIIDFHNGLEDGKKFICKVHFFILRTWIGDAIETDEMIIPTWFAFDQLPLERMMPGDKIFMPMLFAGKKLIGSVYYGPCQKELLQPAELTEVPHFD